MPDPRFFETLEPVRLDELAQLASARLDDTSKGDRLIREVSVLSRAGSDSVTFLSDRRHAAELAKSRAGACFLPPDLVGLAPAGCACLITSNPQAAYVAAAERLHRPRAGDRKSVV